MCAWSLSCASVADTVLESWEGADPSQNPTAAEIIIGEIILREIIGGGAAARTPTAPTAYATTPHHEGNVWGK